MFRIRVCCIFLAALFGQALLGVVSESAGVKAQADPPKGQANQGKNKKPRPQNDRPPAKKEAKPHPTDANLLSLELKALRILRDLEATPHQLSEIARAAKTTAGSVGKREPAKASEAYLDALQQMRHAMLAKDEDGTEKLRTRIDEIEGKEPPDLDDEVEITDGAEIEAVRLLSILSPRQVIAYAQGLDEDFPDPVQLVVDGLEEGRSLKDDEWQNARNKVAEEVGWLVCGFEGEKASKMADQVSAYLDQKHSGEAKSGNRAAEIRTLIGRPGPVVLLKNVMEHTLAELLSNPQVERAARDCLRHDSPHDNPPKTAVAKGSGAKGPDAPHTPMNNAKRPRPAETTVAEATAKRVDLDDVLKAPDDFAGQPFRLDHVTVIGTAQGRAPANILLGVKCGSGTVVKASREQKVSFFMALAKAPEAIKQLKSGDGEGVSATLTCSIRRDGPNHWSARVQAIHLHEGK
jgi:hypothetical protein